ncbi:hypothetical protein [Flavobacterium sp.]|uniref:hypothetical protein n=1 Tax=Flavobacterium sp. TaxID=239 RepID=UPI0037509655
MKLKITLLIMIVCNLGFTQVGINTVEPSAALDINGNLRIRTIVLTTSPAIIKDSILVATGNGMVNRVSSKTIIGSALKTTIIDCTQKFRQIYN